MPFPRSFGIVAIMKYAFTTLLLATLAAGDCAADNCLRALRATQSPGRLGAAREFCATFTAGSVAATAIPVYALNACKDNQNGPISSRLSSACDCIAAATTTTSVPSVTPAPPTLTEACALVSSSSSAQKVASPSGMLANTVIKLFETDCFCSDPHSCCSIGARLPEFRAFE